MRSTKILGWGVLLALPVLMEGAATVTVINGDPAGVGFNDTTPAAPVGGNTGTTIGQQRLIAYQAAANIWGATLTSNVTIRVQATWAALTCTASGAVLGSAGPATAFRDFTGAPVAGHWYAKALANKLANTDLNSGVVDIVAQFNVNLGQPGCLTGIFFYLGLDNNHGSNVDLMTTLLHEFGHGLGFLTLTNGQTGSFASGFPTIFDDFLMDNTTGKTWTNMSAGERVASALNNGHLVWNGPNVTAATPSVLTAGKDASNRALMYAPATFQPGSSVSHYDTTATPNQLMEPISNPDLTHSVDLPQDLTFSLLKDLGWTGGASTISVTIQSSPTGLQFTVDGGAAQTAPQTLNLSAGTHQVAWLTPQNGALGVLYTFSAWADGPTSNPRSISTAGTYTGNFSTSYYLNMVASPSNGGTVSPASGFYPAGQPVSINATANSGFTFTGWTGIGSGSFTGSTASTQVTMNAPLTQTGNFTSGGGSFTTRLNAGGSVYNDPQGNIWTPDPNIANTFTFFTQNPVKNTDKSFLYQSERFSLGTPFSYSFPSVPNGSYVVRLRFAETYFTQSGQRSFNVSINGTQVLTNFDIVAAAGASNTAVDTVHAVTVSGGSITIQFSPVVSNPKISAIEIYPAATTVAVTPGISAPLGQNQTQQFTASVVGNANTAVTWSLNPAVGSISAGGLYTAPGSIANATKVTVTATSVADGTKSSSAIVQLVPLTWTSTVIGTPEIQGSTSLVTNAFSMTGGGDLNGTTDSFRFTATTLNGSSNGSIIARVNQPFTGANPNKAGVMIRDVLTATSTYGFMSYFAGIVGLLQTRNAASGPTTVQFGAAGIPWMRLTKVGTTVAGYVSNDSINWIQVGAPQTVPMGAQQGIGLAVSDGFTGGGNPVTFDNVEVSTSTTAVSINEGLSSLGAGQQAQFTANVTGNANTAVTWSISPAGQGSINASTGLYTAPASITNPSLQTVTVTATSAGDPSKSASVVVFLGGFVPVHVNAGGPSHYDPLGTFWSGDSNAVGGIGNVYSSGATINSTLTPYIYQSERFVAGAALSYKFFVPPGSYTVILKFAEIFFTSPGNRVMNVAINGSTVASNLDVEALAGPNTAFDQTFPGIAPVNGAITITLSPAVAGHTPKVNAIVIQ